MQAYLFPPYMPTKFQIDDQNCRPLAPCQGCFAAVGELTHTYAYHCILYSINSMHTKYQLSILLNIWVMGPTERPQFQNDACKIFFRA